jgi:hypothetical protein
MLKGIQVMLIVDPNNAETKMMIPQEISQEINHGIIDVAELGYNSVVLHPGDVVFWSDLIVSDIETLDTALNYALAAAGIEITNKLAIVNGDEESQVNLANDESLQWSAQPIAEVSTSSGNSYNVFTTHGAIALVDVNLTVIHT